MKRKSILVVDSRKKEIWIALANFVLLSGAVVLLLRAVKSDGIWEEALISFFIFFVFPLFFIKFFLKENFRNCFFNLKKTKNQTEWALAIALVFIFVIWLVVLKWGSEGILWKDGRIRLLLFVNTFFLPLVVFSQEFFFRGFLLRVFGRNWKSLPAIVAQATLFTGFKLLTNPEINNLWRLLALWVMSFILGTLVLRFRSIIVSTVVFWIYLFLVDIYIIYGLNQALIKLIIEKSAT